MLNGRRDQRGTIGSVWQSRCLGVSRHTPVCAACLRPVMTPMRAALTALFQSCDATTLLNVPLRLELYDLNNIQRQISIVKNTQCHKIYDDCAAELEFNLFYSYKMRFFSSFQTQCEPSLVCVCSLRSIHEFCRHKNVCTSTYAHKRMRAHTHTHTHAV